MEATKLFDKIKGYGHLNSKREELREYCSNNVDKILKYLPRRILNSDGGDILDCILNGLLENNPRSSNNKVKILDIVLNVMRSQSTSITHCGEVMTRVCLELHRIPVNDVLRWSDDTVQSIVSDKDVNMIWKDLLPECLSAISSHSQVKHCGTDMSPSEYKEQCVRTLCQCRWTLNQLVQLAAMFTDMQLSRNDHKQVVNKICSYILDVPPDSLPPLVHQLLKLCKTYDIEIVLAHLSNYFNIRVYSKLEPPPQDSASTTMDIDDLVAHSPAELSRCLSTCIYHITQGAAEPELIRKHLKLWPRTQLMKNPFLLDLALSLAEKGTDFKTVCLDVIKSSIEQRYLDEQKSKESAWVKSVLPPGVDVVSVFKVLTVESTNHSQLTVSGLISLAFVLLSVGRSKAVSTACWSLGKLILVRVCKLQPDAAPVLLTQLADKLSGDLTAQKQYADCLYVLCKLTPMSVERCSQLSTILENLQPTTSDFKPAAAVLEAVHPLLNFSTKTRDTMVMVCRKGLYSRDSAHRCVALSGLLSVLRHTRVSTTSSSQSASEQYSAHSYLTQLTLDLHTTQQGAQVTSRVRNEAMCMEVVSILRRCLVQDAAVKSLLYSKLYECAKEKPVLHESILELLYEHFIKYLSEEESVPPLLIDKCVQVTALTATLNEPIARLLFVIAEFLQIPEEDSDDILSSQVAEAGVTHLKNKLLAALEKITEREHLGQVDMDDPGLTDLTPESKAKCIKVQQMLHCYEALIAHQIMQWKSTSRNVAHVVYKIYKNYTQLLDQTKAPPKLGKKGSKGNLNETSKSQKSQKSQKDKPTVKLANLVKDRTGPFKPLPCLWNLELCARAVELLYSEEVCWSSVEQRNQIRLRRDFHHFVLRCVSSALSEHVERRTIATHGVRIAAILYQRCIVRFQDMCDFDDQTTLSCLEVFKECLSLLFSSNYNLKIDTFVPNITGLPESTTSSHMAAILETVHSALSHLEEESESEERDQFSKRMTTVLQQIAAMLLDVAVDNCDGYSNVIIKLEEYSRKCKVDCIVLCGGLLTAGCRLSEEAPLLDDLLNKLTAALGRIDEEDTSAGVECALFPWLDERSGQCVCAAVCTHVSTRLSGAEHLVSRARDLTAATARTAGAAQPQLFTEVRELNKSVVVQLCQLTGWVSKLCKLRAETTNRLVSLLTKLYTVLTAFVRQLDTDLLAEIRLERLLKLSGRRLSGVCDNLITFVEASGATSGAGSGAAGGAARVRRDTRLVPRLVLVHETYAHHVLLLADSAKVNYQQYMSLGTARDFRIKAPVLQEVLLNARVQGQDETRNDDDEINDASTTLLSAPHSDDDDENARPKRKRLS